MEELRMILFLISLAFTIIGTGVISKRQRFDDAVLASLKKISISEVRMPYYITATAIPFVIGWHDLLALASDPNRTMYFYYPLIVGLLLGPFVVGFFSAPRWQRWLLLSEWEKYRNTAVRLCPAADSHLREQERRIHKMFQQTESERSKIVSALAVQQRRIQHCLKHGMKEELATAREKYDEQNKELENLYKEIFKLTRHLKASRGHLLLIDQPGLEDIVVFQPHAAPQETTSQVRAIQDAVQETADL